MNLKQQAIHEAMRECGMKISAIDAHAGLIAECEVLTERLNEAAKPLGFQFTPAICPHADNNHLSAWIQVDYQTRRDIYRAINAAGFMILGETAGVFDGRVEIRLDGFDIQVSARLVDEISIAEAA